MPRDGRDLVAGMGYASSMNALAASAVPGGFVAWSPGLRDGGPAVLLHPSALFPCWSWRDESLSLCLCLHRLRVQWDQLNHSTCRTEVFLPYHFEIAVL